MQKISNTEMLYLATVMQWLNHITHFIGIHQSIRVMHQQRSQLGKPCLVNRLTPTEFIALTDNPF